MVPFAVKKDRQVPLDLKHEGSMPNVQCVR
jgi:hypothetical protein